MEIDQLLMAHLSIIDDERIDQSVIYGGINIFQVNRTFTINT